MALRLAQRSPTATWLIVGRRPIAPSAGDIRSCPVIVVRRLSFHQGTRTFPGGSRQKEGAGMLLDTPADIGLDAPARAGRMMRFARIVRTRWRTLFLVTGAVLTVLGVVLASGAVLLPGILLLLFALMIGIGSSGCTSADLLAGWPWRG
jgi:hypothetical protein